MSTALWVEQAWVRAGLMRYEVRAWRIGAGHRVSVVCALSVCEEAWQRGEAEA